jgi:acetyl esterase/lipase
VRGRRLAATLAALATAFAVSCGRDGGDVTVIRHVPYYEGAGYDAVRHRLDLYLPTGARGYPVLVFVHGGSWRFGDRLGFLNLYDGLARRLAAQGWGVVLVRYRLAPHTKHPGQAWDVARAVGWTYRHVGRYGGDAGRLFLVGHSAGAHLVALVALDRRYLDREGVPAAAVAGVVGLGGVYDLVYAWDQSDWRGHEFAFKPAFGDDPVARAAASPVNYVRATPPPFLLLYGEREHAAFGAMARAFGAKLKAAGGEVRVVALPGRNHYTELTRLGRKGDAGTALLADFVRRHVSPGPAQTEGAGKPAPSAPRPLLPRPNSTP